MEIYNFQCFLLCSSSVHRPVFSLKVKVANENRKLAEKLKEKEKLVWEDGKMLLFSFILTTNYNFFSWWIYYVPYCSIYSPVLVSSGSVAPRTDTRLSNVWGFDGGQHLSAWVDSANKYSWNVLNWCFHYPLLSKFAVSLKHWKP